MKSDKHKLYAHVEFLTSLRPFRNYKEPQALAQASNYIDQAFSQYGLPTEQQTWQVGGQRYLNIVATYNPEKPKRLIIGAHYDVCGEQPGADDNASAVAGLLETARLIGLYKPRLDYRIDFVAYCLEEPPFFATTEMGSYIHAKSLRDAQAEVIGMICYEMIGYYSEDPRSQRFPNAALEKKYPHVGNFILVVGLQAHEAFTQQVYHVMKGAALIDVQMISFADGAGLAGLSDHRNYWAFGYPAVMINDTSFLRNPHYHEISDTIETLDFDKMKAVVDSTYQAVIAF